MKILTLWGVEFANKLAEKYDLIESHPWTNQKILGFKDPSAGLANVSKYHKMLQNTSLMPVSSL